MGRPPGKRRAAPHKKRPAFPSRYPLHVVLRVEPALRGLRKAKIYTALRRAVLVAGIAGRVRIVHISIQQSHVHLLVEASGKDALSRGLQGFQISAAKGINRAVGRDTRRRGKVFSDRYHAEIIKSPNQARHALAYVLNNWRKHREDRWNGSRVDPYSSGWQFDGWTGDDHYLLEPFEHDDEGPLIVEVPRTWLLSAGWRRHGRIDYNEVPSSGLAFARPVAEA